MSKKNNPCITSPKREIDGSLTQLQAAALEATANAIVITDYCGKIIWLNTAVTVLTGYDRQEIFGQSTRIFKSGKNPATLYEEMWRTISDGKVWRGELINRRKDGSLYDEEMTITPVLTHVGATTHYIAVKSDISERKQTAERIRMLANAVGNSPELVGMSGPDGAIVYVNNALQEALQRSRDELVGQHFRCLLSRNNPPGILQEIETKSLEPTGWKGECLVPRKDGTDLSVLLTSSAVIGEDGRVLGILGIAQDITERKQTERQRERLVSLVEASPDFIGFADPMTTQIQYINRHGRRMCGIGEDEDLGNIKISDLHPAWMNQLMVETILPTAIRDKAWIGEGAFLHRNGREIPISMVLMGHKAANGEVDLFYTVSRDITEQKHADELLHNSENKHRVLFEESADANLLMDEQSFIDCNTAALQMFGCSTKAELIAMHPSEISPANQPDGTPSRAGADQRMATAFRKGKSRFEWWYRRGNGEVFPAEVCLTRLTLNGRPVLMGTVRDMTESKTAQIKEREIAARLKLATEAARLGVWEYDLEKNTLKWDRKMFDLYGVRQEEFGGVYEDWVRGLHPDDVQRARATLEAAIAEKVEWHDEFRVVWPSGETHYIEAHSVVQRTPTGSPQRVIGVNSDISERKRAEHDVLFKTALLEAQAETTIDGILAVDESDRIILSNAKFATIFDLPSKMIRAGDDHQLLSHVASKTENRQEFIERVEYLYKHREEKSRDELRLKDGRTIDRYSSPLVDSTGKYHGRIWYFRDITERVRSEERTRLWSRVLDQSGEGIFVCDPQERILIVNAAFERLTGFPSSEAVGKTPRILQSGRQDRAFYTDMWKAVQEVGAWRGEIWNRRKSGEIYAEWLSVSAICDAQDAVTHYIGIFSDITAHKEAAERIAHLAHYDALTDLPNRVLLMDRLDQLTRSAERRKFKLAVVFIDLDHFKDVNDSLGHQAGDLLLQTVAKRFSSVIRAEDTLARIGGDEFVAVFQGIRDGQDASIIAKELFSCLGDPITLSGHEITVTASMGISLYPEDATDGQEMIRNADAAMYQAKGAGRNAYQFYTSEMNQRALEILSMESGIRRAIERQEFVLYYQPQVDILSGSVVGAEALVRWKHPELGLVMPGKFISVAEERGLIVPLGSWVIDEAARQASVWQSGGMPIRVAVNVSAVQFRQKGFAEELENRIQKHGITPAQFEIELTERIIMRDAETTIEILEKLHKMGFQLSIDDFGTGYSSLSYLRRFPIDRIKIDQSFMKDESGSHIVTAVIGLARGFRLKVIAEGVETKKQLEFLREQGCNEAQGYLFSPALTPENFERFVRHRNVCD